MRSAARERRGDGGGDGGPGRLRMSATRPRNVPVGLLSRHTQRVLQRPLGFDEEGELAAEEAHDMRLPRGSLLKSPRRRDQALAAHYRAMMADAQDAPEKGWRQRAGAREGLPRQEAAGSGGGGWRESGGGDGWRESQGPREGAAGPMRGLFRKYKASIVPPGMKRAPHLISEAQEHQRHPLVEHEHLESQLRAQQDQLLEEERLLQRQAEEQQRRLEELQAQQEMLRQMQHTSHEHGHGHQYQDQQQTPQQEQQPQGPEPQPYFQVPASSERGSVEDELPPILHDQAASKREWSKADAAAEAQGQPQDDAASAARSDDNYSEAKSSQQQQAWTQLDARLEARSEQDAKTASEHDTSRDESRGGTSAASADMDTSNLDASQDHSGSGSGSQDNNEGEGDGAVEGDDAEEMHTMLSGSMFGGEQQDTPRGPDYGQGQEDESVAAKYVTIIGQLTDELHRAQERIRDLEFQIDEEKRELENELEDLDKGNLDLKGRTVALQRQVLHLTSERQEYLVLLKEEQDHAAKVEQQNAELAEIANMLQIKASMLERKVAHLQSEQQQRQQQQRRRTAGNGAAPRTLDDALERIFELEEMNKALRANMRQLGEA